MKESWKQLGIKDKIQYITAVLLIVSGITIAFLSFTIIHTINSGVLIYIAQAFISGGAIFGVSIYFKNQLGTVHNETMNTLRQLIEDVVNKQLDGKQ